IISRDAMGIVGGVGVQWELPGGCDALRPGPRPSRHSIRNGESTRLHLPDAAVHSRAGRLLPVALLSGAHAPLPRPDSLATRDRGGPHPRPRAVPAAAHRREARHALPRYARAADRLAGPRPPRHAVARRDPQGRLRAEALTTPGHRA